MKKMMVVLLALSGLTQTAGLALSQESKAYYINHKGFRMDLIKVDDKELNMRDFQKLVKEKSPRAFEMMTACTERIGSSGFAGFAGLWIGYRGFGRYQQSAQVTSSEDIIRMQCEGLLGIVLAGVLMVNSTTLKAEAYDRLNKAIQFFNEDTGRIKVSLNTTGEYPIAFRASCRF